MKLIEIRGIDIRRIRSGPPKVSAQKLADFVGVTRKTIVNWENDVGSPTIVQFAKICFCCKISVGKYMTAAENREDENKAIDLASVKEDD